MNPIYWYLLLDATDDTPDTMMSGDGDAFLLTIIMVLCIVFVGICVKFLWDISK